MSLVKRYSTTQIAKLDEEARKLVNMFSSARIKIGLELARRLKEIEDNQLYLRLDSEAYPNFYEYLKSLNVNYKTAREIIGVYECFVLTAERSINELADTPYHNLTSIKPYFFEKEEGVYKLVKSQRELTKWLGDAKVMSAEDLGQKRREKEIGEHQHKFIKFKVCSLCKLKEITN